jgi:Antitoxin FitA-like, ribbon-helix-helix
MSVNIQIRDVPEEVRDRIVAHAADRGLSMQGYLLSMLSQVAARPTRADWQALAAVREQAPVDMAAALAVIREGRDEGLNAGEYPR